MPLIEDTIPNPTPIFRFIHVDNLHIYLRRGGMHAAACWPDDGLIWKANHDEEVQSKRQTKHVPCGPGGTLHDYVPFYFGPRSPMLYRLHTGWVKGYTEGQEPLVCLVSTAQTVATSNLGFAFSDGHGIAGFTKWFDRLADLEQVDWQASYATWWRDTVEDMDMERRKQAEFLVHRFCPWQCVQEIGVLNRSMKAQVEAILAGFPEEVRRVVMVKRDWYY